MIKAAVLGSPISHSLSPLLHHRAYEILGIPASYDAILCDEGDFPDFLKKIADQNWTGFSLTMPLKEVAISYLSEIDPASAKIDSINTLVQQPTGWFGISTDRLAFANLLKDYNFSNVAIIGGGGTARAALGALDGKCGEMDILLRNPDRAEKLSSCLTSSRINIFDMKHDLAKCLTSSRINIFDMKHDLAKYDLVIATVPMGVSDMVTIDASSVSGLLLEALYRPWPTKLVERWEIAGGNVISGLDLLVEQALFQIELFSKVKFDFDAMRMELLQVGHRALAL